MVHWHQLQTSNLFTNTGFVSGNLINIGTIDQLHGGSATPLTLDYWAYNADDATVVIANHKNPYLRLLKIDLNGNNISESTQRWHDVGASLTINSGSELINYWSTGNLHTSETTPFTKNASFDIIVNNSPAYYAFDDNATTQWVSQSNRYDSATGDYGPTFVEPQVNMTSNASGGYTCGGSSYDKTYYFWKAFNGDFSPSSDGWASAQNVYNTSTGAYTGSANLGTIVGGTAPNGEYIFLDLPYVVTLKAVKIICRDPWSTEYDHAPVDWTLYGRASSSTWTQIQQFTNATYTEQVKTFNLTTAATGYDSFAIVVTKLGGGHNVILSEIEFVTNLPPSFSGTPPSTITLTGVWGSAGYNYQVLSHTTGSVVYHMVNTANNVPFGGYGIVFTIVSNQLRLYVNDSTHGWTEPTSFSINGNAASEGDVVNGNDTIALILSNSNITDTFTVPSELTVVGLKRLASTTDAGEYQKLIWGMLKQQLLLSNQLLNTKNRL